ncbi:carbohydrate ABC transporter permease [Kribbella qitaiheensis]|uniref:Carbohydrate ABC transporter permease n=1 Tax=Kribbella qitaiheensis TaxID=1544730 RepID=A0A7G6WZ15_9ACTN|nr:carbohydrate ABC transporter permease [Kribbella qitaiheensis]QNE19230.1 carbohydrate ABC transporter permease [Kribbella qitaiheensis]
MSRRLKVGVYAVLLVCCVPFVFPTWWMATASLKPVNEIFAFPPSLLPRSVTLDAYRKVFELQPFGQQYLNSFYIAVLVTLGTLVISSLAGYGFARIKFRGSGVVFMIVLTGLLVPNEVTIIPLYRMFDGLGLVNTHWPLILIPVLGAPSVLATFIMRQFFITLPRELEEAGRMDGLGRFGLFWQVSLPLAKPAVGAVSIFTFLHSWNLYLEPIVFLSSKDKFTIPQALTQYVDAYGGAMWNVQLAAATLSALPVLIVFVLAQRHFVEGLAQTGLKG